MNQPQPPQLEGVDHHFVELPGLHMHVAEAGSGVPVLLLHGFPQHWWEWRIVIPGLAERFRVICPDLRGAGWSAAPRRGRGRQWLPRRMLSDFSSAREAFAAEDVELFVRRLREPSRARAGAAFSTRWWILGSLAEPGIYSSIRSTH